MFSQDIVASDAFLEMPTSSRELYFQLGMYADDDGFVNPKKIVRLVGASDDDLKILIAKRFVLIFENGVIVIKHWKINNTVRPDRYVSTTYSAEARLIRTKPNKSYTEVRHISDDKIQLLASPRQDGGKKEAQYSREEKRRDTEQGSEVLPKKEWNYKNTLEEMQEDKNPVRRMLSFFWVTKDLNFDNSKQLSLRYKRDYRPAKLLIDSGYTKEQIKRGFEYVQKKYGDIDWTIETILKTIAEANK